MKSVRSYDKQNQVKLQKRTCLPSLHISYIHAIHFILAYAYLFYITRNHARENSWSVSFLAFSEQLICLAIHAKLHGQISVSPQDARFF